MTDKLVKLSDVEEIIKIMYASQSTEWREQKCKHRQDVLIELLPSIQSLPTIEPLEFTPYDYRGHWASEESKECIREQHNNKIKIHYHGMDNIYSTN